MLGHFRGSAGKWWEVAVGFSKVQHIGAAPLLPMVESSICTSFHHGSSRFIGSWFIGSSMVIPSNYVALQSHAVGTRNSCDSLWNRQRVSFQTPKNMVLSRKMRHFHMIIMIFQKKTKYVQTMFKQCLNQGTQSLTMPVSNFFKFTCRSEHMMSMEQDRNGSKWITLRFYLRDTRGSKTYCNILPLRQQKSAKISKNQQNLHPSTSASC